MDKRIALWTSDGMNLLDRRYVAQIPAQGDIVEMSGGEDLLVTKVKFRSSETEDQTDRCVAFVYGIVQKGC